MSIDKTLRLTEQSNSQATTYLDSILRGGMNDFSDSLYGQPKLSSSHSLSNLREQSSRYSELEFENQTLKAEIISLKKQLKGQKDSKNNGKIQLQEEIFKLKKLIQKSYYTLRGLENENINIKNENCELKFKNSELEQKMKYMEQKVGEMCDYVKNIKDKHAKQVSIIWQRVAHLQKNLEAVVKLIEEDRIQEKKYQNLRNSNYGDWNEKRLNYY